MNHGISHKLAVVALIAGIGSPLVAQSAGESRPENAEESTILEEKSSISWTAHADVTYFDETDFDDGSGTLKALRTAVGIRADMKLGEGKLSVGFDAAFTDYDFEITSGNSFDDVTSMTLSAMYRARLNDKGFWFVGGSINSAYESGAQFEDSFSGAVLGGYLHKMSDTLDLGIGVMVKTRLEDDVLVLPVPQIRYNMGNGWTLESQRAGVRVMYAMNESLSFGLSGEYQSSSFRLDETNAIPEGAATESRIPIAFRVEYKPSTNFRIHGHVGAALGNQLEFFDNAGNTISEPDLDTSIFFGFGGSFTF